LLRFVWIEFPAVVLTLPWIMDIARHRSGTFVLFSVAHHASLHCALFRATLNVKA
jgi:hypothetical protein